MPKNAEDVESKPPYRIPTMAEIRKRAGTNGLSVVSTFTGAGGSCLGFEMAGYRVLWASEFVAAAAEVHRLNFPHCPIDDRDIRDVEPSDILDAVGLESGQIDVLQGSPPCSSFSQAGKRESLWGAERKYSETRQRTDDLFYEFARLLRGLRPRAFVAENVPGLRTGRARGYLQEIAAELKSCGYRVRVQELDAQWLGVPQRRKRLIFVGLRDDVATTVVSPFPRPLPYRYTLADACPWIVDEANDAGVTAVLNMRAHGYFPGKDVPLSEPSATVTTHTGDLFVAYGPPIGKLAIGKEARKLKPGTWSRKYYQLARTSEHDIVPTVTSRGGEPSAASVVAPDGKRKFSIAELRRICGFPDDFELTGNYAQQWERLGRAVPPPMAREIARALAEVLYG
jgi:DNA (cytosine-5)-methyltransferase 1